MPKCGKYHAKWKADMAKWNKYHAKYKITMSKYNKYHAEWQILVPNYCKYKVNGTQKKKQKIIQNLNKKNKNCFKPNKYVK
jgi:transketolase